MPLHPFEDRDVLQSSMRITRAGDGLSTALNIDPVEYHVGDRLYVLLECEVAKLTFEEIKDTEAFRRVHVLAAGVGTILDDAYAAGAIAEQKRLNLKAQGIVELPGVNGDHDDSDEDE